MKKLISILLAISIILLFGINTFAIGKGAPDKKDGNGISWFIKRNGNKRPDITNEQKEIEKYNAYYIDKKVNDDSADKVLYITFDTGYENGNTEKILNILRDKEVPAAFFILDHVVLKNTDLVKRMANEGHLVCNHTKNHKNISSFSLEQIKSDLGCLEKIYNEKTGLTMSKYFRFPEGKYSIEALKCVSELGYKTVFWSFAYDDWDNSRQPDIEKAKEKVLSNTHNGAVILLHSTSGTNAAILGELIDKWRDMGYRFGTLDQLVE